MEIQNKGTILAIVFVVGLMKSGGIDFFSALRKENTVNTFVLHAITQLSNCVAIGLLEADY
jgi:hypothetical protein